MQKSDFLRGATHNNSIINKQLNFKLMKTSENNNQSKQLTQIREVLVADFDTQISKSVDTGLSPIENHLEANTIAVKILTEMINSLVEQNRKIITQK